MESQASQNKADDDGFHDHGIADFASELFRRFRLRFLQRLDMRTPVFDPGSKSTPFALGVERDVARRSFMHRTSAYERCHIESFQVHPIIFSHRATWLQRNIISIRACLFL